MLLELSPSEIETSFVMVQALIIAISVWIAGGKLLLTEIDIKSESDFHTVETIYEIVFLAGIYSFMWAFNDIVVYLGPSLDYLLHETLILLRGVFVIGGLAISRTIVSDRWLSKSVLASILVIGFLLQAFYGIWIGG